MNVLSLCDGMSCGQIALERIKIYIDNYYASEIKDIAIKVTQHNYPDTIQIGDLTKIYYKDGILHTPNGDFKTTIDLVMFGSPCQTLSVAMKSDKRIGLEDKQKSGLFYECLRILKEVNPKYFLMENVASMSKENEKIISSMMGVESIKINSKVVAPMLRNRLYWTNIPTNNIVPKNIKFQDILDDGYTDRDKARTLTVAASRPHKTPIKMFHRYFSTGFTNVIFKDEQHYRDCCDEYIKLTGGKRKCKGEELDNYDGHVFDGVRYMNQHEMERCQTVPEGYTDCLTRNQAANVLGDGWTVDVIAHILSGIYNIEKVCFN